MNKITDKKEEVMAAITPILESFGIKDFDYTIDQYNFLEHLRINDTVIGVTGNSITAIINDIIGYLFIVIYCKHRYIGPFKIQTLNVLKEYWVKQEVKK